MGLPNPSLAIISLSLVTLLSLTHASPAQDFVDSHNKVRAQIGVPPLTWNTTLADYALSYTNTRTENCEMVHSQGPYGENIAEGSGEFTAADAVALWVGEKDYYDHHSNTCVGGECLHYTQVVWRNSKHLGCARVLCQNQWWFVLCSYDPPGNYVGERPY